MFGLFVILPYLILVGLVFFTGRKFFNLRLPIRIIICALMLLAPFWDILITKVLMIRFQISHSPLQQISSTITQPESVVWIDDAWPKFDEQSRRGMIEAYLDGINLKSIAIKGNDGKFYVYNASPNNFAASHKVLSAHERIKQKIIELSEKAKEVYRQGGDNRKIWKKVRTIYEPQLKEIGYYTIRKEEIDQIFSNHLIYNNIVDLPKMKYLIHLQGIHLPDWQKRFMWCDQITVKDLNLGTEVAFSKRCIGYSPWFGINPITSGKSFYGGVRLGDEQVSLFDDKVLFRYANGKEFRTSREWSFLPIE